MQVGFAAFIVAASAFGTASGLEIVGTRRGEMLTYDSQRIAASLSGLADLVLIVVAFFRFPLGQAVTALVAAAAATAVLSPSLPSSIRPGLIYLFTLIGVVAAIVHFAS